MSQKREQKRSGRKKEEEKKQKNKTKQKQKNHGRSGYARRSVREEGRGPRLGVGELGGWGSS